MPSFYRSSNNNASSSPITHNAGQGVWNSPDKIALYIHFFYLFALLFSNMTELSIFFLQNYIAIFLFQKYVQCSKSILHFYSFAVLNSTLHTKKFQAQVSEALKAGFRDYDHWIIRRVWPFTIGVMSNNYCCGPIIYTSGYNSFTFEGRVTRFSFPHDEIGIEIFNLYIVFWKWRRIHVRAICFLNTTLRNIPLTAKFPVKTFG